MLRRTDRSDPPFALMVSTRSLSSGMEYSILCGTSLDKADDSFEEEAGVPPQESNMVAKGKRMNLFMAID